MNTSSRFNRAAQIHSAHNTCVSLIDRGMDLAVRQLH